MRVNPNTSMDTAKRLMRTVRRVQGRPREQRDKPQTRTSGEACPHVGLCMDQHECCDPAACHRRSE